MITVSLSVLVMKQVLQHVPEEDTDQSFFICRLFENPHTTRMHSSRMRTGRALTVSGGGVGASQKNFLGGGELKKKGKKIGDPPETLETPPKNWRPPEKLETTPPPVDRHTLVKILPWPNFVVAGNNNFLEAAKNNNSSTSLIYKVTDSWWDSTEIKAEIKCKRMIRRGK